MPNICYSQEDIEKLSKIRIIQKNLVHFQGFPDNISNPEILSKKEYFGQFGTIIKIMISSKEDKITKKKITQHI
jgi:CCR4-NOT transcription complex subunit 4